jgi:peroxiredoxin
MVLLVCTACITTGTPPPAADAAHLAPDFTAITLSGESYTLSALRGRWVILNFWATWCAPCVEEMPALQHIADTYGDEVVLLGMNLRDSAETVSSFVAQHGLRFPILINPDDSILLNYQVIGLPQTLVISPSGEIVYRQFGPVDFDVFTREVEPLFRP